MAVAVLLQACSTHDVVKVEVRNATDLVRMNEMVELDYADVLARLSVSDTIVDDVAPSVVVYDAYGDEVAYQVTFDNKLIFPTAVEPNSVSRYTIEVGVPSEVPLCAVGDCYPQRVDDIAWENDCIAFRAYGPALQASGEKAYGYDVWVKRVEYPVVADRYAAELDSVTVAEVARLKSVDPDSAARLYNSVSYHVDHGNGLDYYKVGPTLGAGTSALLDVNGEIVYPYCYEDYEILDNGPLRFTVSLRYRPFVYGDEEVVETRVITLDKGSQFNRIDVVYHNLSSPATMVSGIVLHDVDGVMEYDAQKGYAAYAEPVDSINGCTYLGMVYGHPVQHVSPLYFDEAERTQRGATGHLLMERIYQPGETVTYYAGAGWSKWGFDTAADWAVYVNYYADILASPLEVVLK